MINPGVSHWISRAAAFAVVAMFLSTVVIQSERHDGWSAMAVVVGWVLGMTLAALVRLERNDVQRIAHRARRRFADELADAGYCIVRRADVRAAMSEDTTAEEGELVRRRLREALGD